MSMDVKLTRMEKRAATFGITPGGQPIGVVQVYDSETGEVISGPTDAEIQPGQPVLRVPDNGRFQPKGAVR